MGSDHAAPDERAAAGVRGCTMLLSSVAFCDGCAVPAVHATRRVPGGANVSIPLEWRDPPDGTRSFAIAMVDRHPVAKGWVHWLVIDVPAHTRAVPAGASGTRAMSGAVELTGSWGTHGYGGPQPPAGTGDHVYETTVYALDVEHLGLPAAATMEDARARMKGHVLGTAVLRGTLRT